MTDQPLLSELCSICNNNASKYRCPGCSARTCSLPCYKRHQKWAQCSGKRDPTKYVKRSQLATSAGIDHDYNFIVGIERGVDRAEREAIERGIGISDESRQGPTSGSNYEKHLQDAGVIIDRAPKGMSREKSNNTRFDKRKKRIIWTIEWIHQDQTRELDEVREMLPLSEAYKELLARKQPKSKKRKIISAPLTGASQIPDPIGELKNGDEAASHSIMPSENPMIEPTLEASSNEVTYDNSKDIPSVSSGFHFYLVKPHTSSSRRVLIPLSNETTLSTGLRGRVVLEFPTIQVLLQPPESLPSKFQLESEYLDQELKERNELEELLATVQPPGTPIAEYEGGPARSEGKDENLDDKKILEVLRRDLSSCV
ncbi:hypothetical protein AOQ84DRAFT_432231 [Glonium stellatum]|uniref:Box C/D snoRNA protein 1 n=1 Tax=Glonium stellatum TaxID=574774 RepID=A0A8E2EYJ4_9PEZI|nr:hypothetical protein AOQ84DRAFT_432231 [Glonium stellatum]